MMMTEPTQSVREADLLKLGNALADASELMRDATRIGPFKEAQAMRNAALIAWRSATK
jgi:hypothetical protein